MTKRSIVLFAAVCLCVYVFVPASAKALDTGNEISHGYLDNIVVTKNIRAVNSRIIKSDLSDHYPVFAYLVLSKALYVDCAKKGFPTLEGNAPIVYNYMNAV